MCEKPTHLVSDVQKKSLSFTNIKGLDKGSKIYETSSVLDIKSTPVTNQLCDFELFTLPL